MIRADDILLTAEELRVRGRKRRNLLAIVVGLVLAVVATFFGARPAAHSIKAWQARSRLRQRPTGFSQRKSLSKTVRQLRRESSRKKFWTICTRMNASNFKQRCLCSPSVRPRRRRPSLLRQAGRA